MLCRNTYLTTLSPSAFTRCPPAEEIEALRDGASEAAEPSWEVVSSILPKGAVSFHEWRTVHGSDPNRSKGQRRGLAIHMCSAGSVSAGGPLTAHLSDPRANPPPAGGVSRL